MANKELFKSIRGGNLPAADTVNEAGGVAYSLTAKHALAQYAATGTLSRTFYASAEQQLNNILKFCSEVEPQFIAKTAIYSRQRGYMKDMPALLCAILSKVDIELCKTIFPVVIDNGRMLRNFVQIIRSGLTGRQSLGYAPRNLIRAWMSQRSDAALFRASVGNDPSLVDIIKMVHPKPKSEGRNALFGYLLGREYSFEALPQIVKHFEAYKRKETDVVPNVDFRLLTSLELGKKEWIEIAKNGQWQWTRMNLNTMARHEVFDDPEMVTMIAERLRNREAVVEARQFPYQMLTAYLATANNMTNIPREVLGGLQDALDISVDNVPSFDCPNGIYVFPDVSVSMRSPVTGSSGRKVSVTQCKDVAALVASSVLRRNEDATVIPFAEDIRKISLNERDSVIANARELMRQPGGSTNCSAPLTYLNEKNAKGDLIIYVSDYESWVDKDLSYKSTRTLREWKKFKKRNPNAKMVCIDVTPYDTAQAPDSGDILNIGGFSDTVWPIIHEFVRGNLNVEHWIGVIESIELP